MKIDGVSAYILSGGKSQRMGENKAFLSIKNERFIDILYRNLSILFHNVFIITKEDYGHLYKNYDIIYDIYKDQSPIIGILTALIHSKNNYVFIKSCDNPFFSEKLIRMMSDLIKRYDAVVPNLTDGLHPLFAIYSKNCIKAIKEQIEKNNFKVVDFLNRLDVYFLREEEVIKFDENLISFININTKEDYESFKRNYL
ncbi:MAG: molybdenum cofactor guanylyltransferase [Proteobacteria bacterium]|nr:molybdenum cofactor guanylyltransferase [Pseudomonadota bacterium]